MSDSSMPSTLEQDHLLNDNAAGEHVGGRAVAWLTPIPSERIPRLRLLLQSPDIDVVVEATLILVTWGDAVGLNSLENLVDRRVHTLGEFYPHRIYGYDNIYDVLSDALGDFRGRSDEFREQRQRLFEKLLQLYGPFDFEGDLKFALLKCDFPELERAIEGAIARALQVGKPYLASQLLPPLARFNQAAALARFPRFTGLGKASPNPDVNVAEALRYVSADVSVPLLQQLSQHRDKVVADEARKSLATLAKA